MPVAHATCAWRNAGPDGVRPSILLAPDRTVTTRVRPDTWPRRPSLRLIHQASRASREIVRRGRSDRHRRRGAARGEASLDVPGDAPRFGERGRTRASPRRSARGMSASRARATRKTLAPPRPGMAAFASWTVAGYLLVIGALTVSA